MAIKYPDRIESNNPQAYGIVKATEIAGQRQVKQLSDLYKLPDAILSESKTGEDAEGQIWIVGKDQYQLISWQNRNDASGWQKVIPFNEKMFDRFYNLDGNMINSLTGYIKATELLNLLENDSLLNALGKLEYKADLTYDLVTSVYEGVHTIEELREMLKILEEIQNSSEVLNSYLSKYLPLAGGIMSGSIDMNKNSLKNAGFEVVTTLPTTNLFVGRQVTYNGKIYTYHNGKWISTADDLGDLKETLSSEFVFRPTADTHSVKDEFASVKSIKGNTVVWNQLIKSLHASPIICSLDKTVTTEKKYIINSGSHTPSTRFLYVNEGTNVESTHKLLLKLKYKTNFTNTLTFRYQCYNDTYASVILSYTKDKWSDNSFILTQGWKCGFNSGFHVFNSYVEGEYLSIPNEGGIQLFDLTQMFGEGNEPTIEEFEAMFPNDYYEYNEGELMSFDGKGLKSVGFNQWDEEWENGQFTLEGNIASNPNRIVSSFIKVIPSKKYFYRINQPTIIASDAAFYDENKNCVHYTTAFYINSEFTIPNNVHYIRICPSSTYGNTYNNDICLNLSHNGEKNGEYQPYEEHIVNLPIKKYFPDGLKSAGAVYDEIVFDKNIGKYKAIQRIGSVDMGSFKWNKYEINDSKYVFSFPKPSYIKTFQSTEKANVLTIKYPTVTWSNLFSNVVNYGFAISGEFLRLGDNSFTDAASLKASLQGQILYYELAEPIETIIEDYDLIAYKANDWGTEEVLSEEPTTPIKADIEYNFDATNEIRNHIFEIKKLNKKIDELTALVESLLTTQNVNYEKVEN